MKNLSKQMMVALGLMGFIACSKTEVQPTTDPQAVQKAQVEKMLPVIQTQVKGQQAIQQMIAMISELKAKYLPNGRVSAETSTTGEIPTCAKVSADAKNKTITVDFGTSGCKTPSGQAVSGQMVISIANQIIKTDMKNITIDATSLNGVLELSGMFSKSTSPDITATATNLQVISGGKSSTFNMDLKMKWNAGFTTYDNKTDDDINYSINGNMVVSEGTFDVLTSKDIHQKGSCQYIMAGIIEFKKGTETTKIDFGNDICDDKATVSVGTYTKEVDLDEIK
jgi:hypothetical protein